MPATNSHSFALQSGLAVARPTCQTIQSRRCRIPGCKHTFEPTHGKQYRCPECRAQFRTLPGANHTGLPIKPSAPLKAKATLTLADAMAAMTAAQGSVIGGPTDIPKVYCLDVYAKRLPKRTEGRHREDEMLIGSYRMSEERYYEIVMERVRA